MELFEKLFGGTKDTNFTISDRLMDEDKFWQLIEASIDNSENDFEEQKEQLANELRLLTADEIILFGNRFKFFREEANTLELSGAFYIISGDCEIGSFNDFREWIIGLGKELYYKIIKDPQALVEVETDLIEEANWEGLSYIISTVFKEKTGQKIAQLFQKSDNIKGKEWRKKGDELKKMFPKLYFQYPENI